MNKILNWISHFKDAKQTFSNGCCYWFAYMLNARFGATIWYAPIDGHFVGEINDKFYDINGVYTPNEEMIKWDDIQISDPLWASRIKRDCINFEGCD